jgi:DNA-binding NarL/FixJ family response regulator
MARRLPAPGSEPTMTCVAERLIHVLIVEDHPLYSDALARVLTHAPATTGAGLRCSLARNEAEALDQLSRQTDIDLVVSDFGLQQGNGLQLLETVGQRWPTVARVLMSGSDDAGLCERARRQGLMGFLPKLLEPQRFAQAIASVLAGEPWFPAEAEAPVADSGLLTARQASVLACVAQGQGNKQIARVLGISERTIKYHLEGAFERLGVANRAEAVVLALERGLIRLPRQP